MNFNLDPNMQAQEVIFSRKMKKRSHPPLNFSDNSVKKGQFEKYLGICLDGKLNIRGHLQNMFKKVNKKTSLFCKL